MDTSSQNETSPNVNPIISINVKGLDGTLTQYKIKKKTALRKMMKHYCDKKNLDVSTTRFLFCLERIREDSTCEGLGLENEDEIDVFQLQQGGR